MSEEQKELQSFIHGVVTYFEKMTGSKAEVGVPALVSDEANAISEVTAAIGFTGAIVGAVYLTSTRDFFQAVYEKVYASVKGGSVPLDDIAGEIANTIAGNAQEHFQAEFSISVPLVFQSNDKNATVTLKEPRFKVPVTWQEHKFFLVIGIKAN